MLPPSTLPVTIPQVRSRSRRLLLLLTPSLRKLVDRQFSLFTGPYQRRKSLWDGNVYAQTRSRCHPEELTSRARGNVRSNIGIPRSDNSIEWGQSAFSIVEQVCKNVKRWHGGDERDRWVGSGLLVAQKQFRRVTGYKQSQRSSEKWKR